MKKVYKKRLVKDIKIYLKKKKKKQQYGCKHYKNFSEDAENKLVEYGNKYYRMKQTITKSYYFKK